MSKWKKFNELLEKSAKKEKDEQKPKVGYKLKKQINEQKNFFLKINIKEILNREKRFMSTKEIYDQLPKADWLRSVIQLSGRLKQYGLVMEYDWVQHKAKWGLKTWNVESPSRRKDLSLGSKKSDPEGGNRVQLYIPKNPQFNMYGDRKVHERLKRELREMDSRDSTPDTDEHE